MSRSDEIVPCGRCGADRQRMRLPTTWGPDTVASWRSLEERFLCDACKAEVNGWIYATYGDVTAYGDKT